MPNLIQRITDRIADAWDPTRRLLAQAEIESAIRPQLPAGVVVPPVPPPEREQQRLVAPAPIIDRYPLIIGQNLTGQYLSSAYRLCNAGWRYQFVDLLNELFEHDPHARGVSRQRVLAVAGGRVEIHPAELRPNHPDTELAKEIAEGFAESFENIPARSQALGQLAWGAFYGVSGLENLWDIEETWEVVGLSNIHSRRLNYPDPTNWDLHIYDQGLVGPGLGQMGPTTGVYGMPVSRYPGKFTIHTPALNGDYPTRDGEGRYIGTYMLLKRMVVRATAQDFERTIRPWIVGYFNRPLDGGEEGVATDEDIKKLDVAIKALGLGSLNSATLPNTVKIEILRAASQMNATDFVSFLNREISKAALGQAFTTEPGANGNFGTAEIAKEGTLEILRYDARCVADTLERDIATPWLRLNYPAANRRCLPRITIMVDELPDPEKVTNIASKMAQMDAPVHLDKLSEINGIPLVDKDDKDARRSRMIVGGKGLTPQAGEDPNEGGGPIDKNDDTQQPTGKTDKKTPKPEDGEA